MSFFRKVVSVRWDRLISGTVLKSALGEHSHLLNSRLMMQKQYRDPAVGKYRYLPDRQPGDDCQLAGLCVIKLNPQNRQKASA